MFLRIWLPRILLAAFAAAPAFGGVAASVARSESDRHITINAPASTPAGSMCCVFVGAPGHGGANIEVEIDGKALVVHVVSVGDSGSIICFTVPSGASGETIDITATSGNISASASINVL